MKYIDMFCGMGAFHQALHQQGHECVWACDNDKGVRKIYEKNYGIIPRGEDIKEIPEHEIPEHDILCAGLPFESGFESILFQEVLRILKHSQPKYAIIEHVKNVCVVDEGRNLLSMLDLLDEVGYYVKWNVLNAIDFGLPQCRERVFFVCYRKDIPCKFTFSSISNDQTRVASSVRTIIDKECNDDITDELQTKYEIRNTERKARANGTKPLMIAELINKETQKGGAQGQRIYSIDYPGITICAGSGGVGGSTGLYHVDGKIRTLTSKETLRMFGFPESFIYSCSDRRLITYMGASTCVPIISAIIAKLIAK